MFVYSSYHLNISFPSSGSHFNKLEQVLETPKNGFVSTVTLWITQKPQAKEIKSSLKQKAGAPNGNFRKISVWKTTGGGSSNKGCFGRKTNLFRESGDFAGNRETWEIFREIWVIFGTLSKDLIFNNFLVKHKILPNLVISNWLWWIMRVLLANQNWGNILNE